ncbi:hypothetical protein [Yoonia sp. I 8.24]|uniref:hypothetical protein n=1 Tax=Yoonia sp. I 8.24 TaxID=1537229 RepID=UPI001EDFB06D|nr:hypothetical protein [Yoonia sp. I 8.24]MCG3266802.1 hypothetical protein [Yoonia sp. I 8.24]
MRLMMPLIGLLMLVVAAAIVFTFKIVWDEHVFQQRLVSIEVSAPDGWEAVPYETSHGEAIVGEPLTASDAPATTTQRILRGLDDVNGDPLKGAVWSFLNGQESVVMRMEFAPHRPPRNNILAQMSQASAGPPPPNLDVDVATIHGITLIVKPRVSTTPDSDIPEPVNYRRFQMRFGDQEIDEVLDVTVTTNASDAAVVNALMQVDFARAHGLLDTPDPAFDQSSGVVTPDQQPLASTAPPPSLAFVAAGMLENGEDLGEPWMDVLARIKADEIADWESLIALYPDDIAQIPLPLFELLDDGSQENAARYFAARMRASDRTWNDHEHYILGKIINPESSQADLADYLTGSPDVADDVIALILQLPETGAEAAIDTGPETGQATGTQGANTILQSENCRIENGIRRCTVDGN